MQKRKKLSRRAGVKAGTAAMATTPLLTILGEQAWSAERISESHPTAVALGYVHDGSNVDASQNPTYKTDQRCDNCVQYVATNDGWGTCNIFPGFEVAAPGWCKVWVVKT